MMFFFWPIFVLISIEIVCSSAEIRALSGQKLPILNPKGLNTPHNVNSEETTAEYWNDLAQKFLQHAKTRKPITNVAKNVIFFLGDGMSSPTVTAARIYAGGESYQLSFERFPHTAASKTYLVDRQVSESTATATAYFGGVKANWYTSGLTAAVKAGDCDGSKLPENHVHSIAEWSQEKGKWTGFITTTRVTHASPSALFAHNAHKEWECDSDVEKFKLDPKNCPDVAQQLIHSKVGRNFHVMLGCGRKKFLPKDFHDEEGQLGQRNDKKNLIEEWKDNSSMETHGGDDVMIYAKGPWAHLFSGVMEQNIIPHLMAYASCVGDKSTACDDGHNLKSLGISNLYSPNFFHLFNCILIGILNIRFS